MNADETGVRPDAEQMGHDHAHTSAIAGKPNNLPYPPLGDTFKEPQIFCEMVENYFQQPMGEPPSPCTRLAVYGARGIGKTRAVVEYAWSRADRYTALLFVTAHSSWGLIQKLTSLCPLLGITPESPSEYARYQQVMNWLVDPAHAGWLLIVDGADYDESMKIVKECLGILWGGHLIVTSFDWDWQVNHFSAFLIEQPGYIQGTEYLLERTEGKRKASDDDPKQALALVVALTGMPLAMELAAACITVHGLSFGDYLDRWRSKEPEVAEWDDGHIVEYTRQVAVAWQLTFDCLTPAAQALLYMLAWLEMDPLPRFLFDRQFGTDDLQRNTVNFPTPNEILQLLSGDAEADMAQTLAELRRYGLLQPAGECLHPNEGKLHPSVLLITRQRQPLESRLDTLQAALDLVYGASFVNPQIQPSWSIWEPMADHVAKILRYAWYSEIANPTAQLSNNYGQLMLAKGQVDWAEDIMNWALMVSEKSLEPDHPDIALRLYNLANVKMVAGKRTEAEPLLRRLLGIAEGLDGGQRRTLYIGLNLLGKLVYELGRRDEGEALVKRALNVAEELLPPDDPQLAPILTELVAMLFNVPRLAEAEPVLRRLIRIEESYYGLEHPKISDHLNNLAILLQNTNRPAEAEMVMRRALYIDEKALGAEHPNVARDLHSVAYYYQSEKRFAEAEPLMRRALAIEEKCFGPDDGKIAIALNNLALVLADTHRLEEAEPLMRRGLAINEANFGPDSEEVAIVLNNLSQLLESLKRQDESINLMRRQLVIFLKLTRESGQDHPTLKHSIGNYLSMLKTIPLGKLEYDQLLADLGPEAGFDELSFRRLRKRVGL